MIEIELDGKKVEVAEGSMVMHAADKANVYIPHFCYHRKLSIAANCRMCLVDIEKAPKPMPACATPVTQGMVVRSRSDKALNAQQGVMEFLLINHPLDCPICDQGGECQLQDLAVGYGAPASRYSEEKRVVVPKEFGPLISAREMHRCIHCTRCIRFGEEIGGVMELGMVNRGEWAEVDTVDGTTIDSEVSGNMIDLCPVGALTSKPFRYTARTWELSRRKSVSPHDSTGSNLIVQVKGSRVMRVLPLDNEEVNECWIADRDRFSYEALGSAARLTQPMIRQGGEWQTVDWAVALEYVATGLRHIGAEHGASSIGAVASAASTVEELHLLARLVRGLGSANIDHRTRHADPANTVRAADGRPAARWLGTSIASLSQLERALVVGSFLRKDHPLFALRLRHAARHGCKVHSLHALRDDWLMPMAESLAVAPSGWVEALAEVAAVVAEARGVAAPRPAQPGEAARAIAASLGEGERKAVLLGQAVAQHPQAGTLLELANWIGEHTGASVGYLGEAANSLGAQLVDALPGEGGLDAGRMLGAEAPLKACLLLNVDPALEVADGPTAVAALHSAEMVVALTTFHGPVSDVADVLLPIAPFTETSGTFVNAEGRVQSFHGAVKPLGETRPGWKVLRVLGNLLELDGFDFESSEEVREAALGDREALAARLDNRGVPSAAAAPVAGLERIADVPIYMSDAMVRNAPSLQQTADARPPQAGLSRELWNRLGFAEGDRVRIVQGNGSVELPARLDPTLAANAVRVAAGHPDTAALGPMFGTLQVERVAARQPMAATEDVRG